MARAFDVPIASYRGRKGGILYASTRQPSIPSPLRGVVSGLGRIDGYTPHHMARPGFSPSLGWHNTRGASVYPRPADWYSG